MLRLLVVASPGIFTSVCASRRGQLDRVCCRPDTYEQRVRGSCHAAYGGIYIAASLLWLWIAEGQRPHTADLIGAGLRSSVRSSSSDLRRRPRSPRVGD